MTPTRRSRCRPRLVWHQDSFASPVTFCGEPVVEGVEWLL
jgi:hypothetical protein